MGVRQWRPGWVMSVARRPRRQARPWQFWRRAFWTRPALLVLYALLAGAIGLLVVLAVPGDVRDARGMARAAECPRSAVRPQVEVDAPQGCLERIPVILSGPHYRRGPGSEWWLHIEGNRAMYVDVDLSSAGSRRLSDGDRAEALLWQGEPVLIEPEPGDRVETDNWGHRGWLITLFIGMFILSGLPLLLQSARFKRKTASGWWSVDGEEVGLVPVMTPLTSVACLLAIPVMLGSLPLMFGGGAGWAVSLALIGLALAIFAIAVHALRARRD